MVKKIILALLILLFFGNVFLVKYLQNRFFSSDIINDGGRTNFLLLGVHGVGNSQEDLTDTIIFASISPEKKITLISIPRDIWIEDIQAKINSAYHYGGPDLIKKTIETIVGQKIHYYVFVNFSGFEKAVDYLGGININVQNGFDDYYYPIAGKEDDLCDGDKEFKCRYEHLHFEPGLQVMDGSTALKFVRSRNAAGDEGTDFARAQRQQLFLTSFKDEIMSPEVYSHPQKLLNLYNIFREYTFTNIREDQYGKLLLNFAKVQWGSLKTVILNDNLLVHPKTHYSKQWVLVPATGTWEATQEYLFSILKDN